MKAYIQRNWGYIQPFGQRESLFGFESVVGTCESNHRIYTYRMKNQGKYWSPEGALSMTKLLSAKRNKELAKYSLYQALPSSVEIEVSKGIIRASLKSAQPEYRGRYMGNIPNPQLRARINHVFQH